MVAVIGAGTKGTGIAEVFVRAGHAVRLFDIDKAAAANAVRLILAHIQRDVEAEKLPPHRLEQARQTLQVASAPADLAEAVFVVESVAENLELKRKVLHGIEDWISPAAIVLTNTGWLSVNAIGTALQRRNRFAGYHFLTPPSTPLVEIVPALTTSGRTIEALQTLARGTGHTAVVSADLPGFVVAHLNRGLMGEAARLLEADVAPPHAIDAILRASLGLAHGPFELYDTLGLDVVARAARHIWEGWGGEPRFRDVPLLATRVAAGYTGHDGHRGFYESRSGGALPPLMTEPAAPWDGPVFVSNKVPDLATAVRTMLKQANLVERPSGRTLNIVTPLGTDALGDIVAEGLDPARSVGVDVLLPGKVMPIANTPVTTMEIRRGAAGLFQAGGFQPTLVHDTPGQIAQRVAAMIVAVGYAMLDKGVATGTDIDAAATKALGYTMGPFALSRRIGVPRVVAILQSLQAITGDARWRVPANLRHVALLTPGQQH